MVAVVDGIIVVADVYNLVVRQLTRSGRFPYTARLRSSGSNTDSERGYVNGVGTVARFS